MILCLLNGEMKSVALMTDESSFIYLGGLEAEPEHACEVARLQDKVDTAQSFRTFETVADWVGLLHQAGLQPSITAL